jgi:HPt (histidine-containing phosphotransfer) domain-containing protein
VVVEVPEDYRDLVRIYFDTRSGDLDTLARALAGGDFAAIQRVGHALRGSSASYGFTRVGEIGLELERAAESGNGAAVTTLTESLRDYLVNVEVRFVKAPR